jgi:hypothetical protein
MLQHEYSAFPLSTQVPDFSLSLRSLLAQKASLSTDIAQFRKRWVKRQPILSIVLRGALPSTTWCPLSARKKLF